MINLLPNELKEDIAFARRNTILLRWSITLIIAIVGMGAIVLGGQFYMRQSINAYSKQLEKQRNNLQVNKLEETQKRLEDISKSVKLVVSVLSREVLFSELLRQLGSVTPADTILLQLQIDQVQGGLTLRAKATSIEAATQLLVNLQDPENKIFQKADIESINCAQAGTDPAVDARYPCSVQIRALFTKDNPFLFINSKSAPKGNS